MCSEVSDEPTVSITRAENEGSTFTNLYGIISQMSIKFTAYWVVQQKQKYTATRSLYVQFCQYI